MLFSFTLFLLSQSKIYKFTGAAEEVTLKAGNYTIECYGAQGGGSFEDGKNHSDYGGKGAYTKGILIITGPAKNFFVNVGGQGIPNYRDPGLKEGINKGGFNGGGDGGKDIGSSSDDAAGGGGGATDFRYLKNEKKYRIMVAAGGSGAAYTQRGLGGGTLTGYAYECYKTQLQVVPPGKKCVDLRPIASPKTNQTHGGKNGIGGNGIDADKISGGGGGGGWMGGVSSGQYGDINPYKSIAHSGSSYISGMKGCKNYSSTMIFLNPSWKENISKGDGKLIITTNYQCSANCFSCTSSAKCTKCMGSYKLYKNKCVSPCNEGNWSNSTHCIQCETQNCANCSKTVDKCFQCKKGYYLYGNKCYSDCTTLNQPLKNIYFGKDDEFQTCRRCIGKCINCAENRSRCTECQKNYHLNELSLCEINPTEIFSPSEKFSPSSDFSFSPKFSQSSMFSESLGFSESSYPTETQLDTDSNSNKDFDDFTQSDDSSSEDSTLSEISVESESSSNVDEIDSSLKSLTTNTEDDYQDFSSTNSIESEQSDADSTSNKDFDESTQSDDLSSEDSTIIESSSNADEIDSSLKSIASNTGDDYQDFSSTNAIESEQSTINDISSEEEDSALSSSSFSSDENSHFSSLNSETDSFFASSKDSNDDLTKSITNNKQSSDDQFFESTQTSITINYHFSHSKSIEMNPDVNQNGARNDKKKKSIVWIIVGVVIGVIAAFLILIIIFIIKRRQNNEKEQSTQEMNSFNFNANSMEIVNNLEIENLNENPIFEGNNLEDPFLQQLNEDE